MEETTQYVDEAVEVLHTLQMGQSNGLSPFLFQKAIEALEPGHPQIVAPLKRCLMHPDAFNVRFRVLEMISNTGSVWPQLYGAMFADEVVLSVADSNLLCAASAARAVQMWEPGGPVSTAMLLWAKRHFPGQWIPKDVEANQMPQIPQMIKELPTYQDRIIERRDLANDAGSLENNIRLFGKFKGSMMSMFRKE